MSLKFVLCLVWFMPFVVLCTESELITIDINAKSPIAESVAFKVIKNESIKTTGEIVGRYFFVEFDTLPDINPKASGYFIVAFQNQQIPYKGQNKPVAAESIPCTTSDCSHALEADITQVPYIVGIGSSHSIDTISTTLNFMPGDTKGTPFNPSVSVLQMGVNSVIVAYDMPLGYNPKDSKAWVGIWENNGRVPPELLGKADINSIQSTGSQAINGITVQINSTYDIRLFSGPKEKDIVGKVTIKVESD